MAQKTKKPLPAVHAATPSALIGDIRQMIEETRSAVAVTINAGLTMLYWRLGRRILQETLKGKRAGYGEEILATLSQELTRDYGKGFSEKGLRHMVVFAETFSDERIVSTLWRQLGWSHFKEIIYLKDSLQREFYAELCRVERWSVRVLRQKIDSMLFERTAISRKPEELIKKELAVLRDEDRLSPDLVFRDPYILDFLNLEDTWSEDDLEAAILRELERFLLELGVGFAFVARQKRMTIDGEDFHLDLLLLHRRLHRLVAVELKFGKFKAEYKGKMELYLRWLEENEMLPGEEPPLGLILCAEGNSEQIQLLRLDAAGMHVAEYMTELPSKEMLKKKLHSALRQAKAQLEHRGKRTEQQR